MQKSTYAMAMFLSLFISTGAYAQALKVMPLGDSITESIKGYGSYRCFLSKMLKDKGYKVNFVVSMW